MRVSPAPTPETSLKTTDNEPELIVSVEVVLEDETVDGTYQVALLINVESEPGTNLRSNRSVAVMCKSQGSEARQCGDEWHLGQTTTHGLWTGEFTINVPAGRTDIEVTENGTPLRTYGLFIEASQSVEFGNFANAMLYDRREFDPGQDFMPMDIYITESNLPDWSNGLAVRNLGYRSNGTATLEFLGANSVLRPGDTILCERQDSPDSVCDGAIQELPGGLYSKFTAELPFGATVVNINRSGESIYQAELTVSERILGVPQDVLECFTDTTFADAAFMPDLAIGCAGWYDMRVKKWDGDRPVRIKLTGPTQWTSFFVETLTELESLFNLEFEWITDDGEYDLEAIVGITHEQSLELGIACSEGPTTGGCASTDIMVGGTEQHITIYNIYPDLFQSAELPTSEARISQLRSTILHEAVHAFTGMGHRIEAGTLMYSEENEFLHSVSSSQQLSPMDRQLVKLHAHPLVKRRMTFNELEQLVITQEQLIDGLGQTVNGGLSQESQAFSAWSIVYSAFQKLRASTTARYIISTELPGCDERVTDAVYQVGNIRKSETLTGWANLTNGDQSLYLLRNPTGEQDELWEAQGTSWELSNVDMETTGWLPNLSDPYRLLIELILYADWSQVTTVNRGQGIVGFETTIRTPDGVEKEIRVDINTETSVVTGFTAELPLEDSACDGYQITASEGTFGQPFTWPGAIQAQSMSLHTCAAYDLPPNPRAVRQSGKFNRECQSDGAHIKSFTFTTDRWSLLRIDLDAPHEVSAVIKGRSGDDITVSRSTDVRFPEGLAGYGIKTGDHRAWQFDLLPHGAYLWHHDWLPPGSYQIDIMAPPQQFPGQYTLVVDSQPIPGEPSSLRFKAVATSTTRTCALITDGTPLCWGRPTDSSDNPTIPDGPFDTIFGGYHFCALTTDGAPLCWDFKEAGEHDCSETNTGRHCVVKGQVQHSSEGLRDQSSGFVGGRYYDQTPPAQETFTMLAPGRNHTCGLHADGSVLCWGEKDSFNNQPLSEGPFKSVISANGFWCALENDGTPNCWGSYYEPTLPNDDTKFTQLSISFSYGPYRMCGLDTNGQARCFGINQYCDPSEASIEPCFDVTGGDSDELRELYRGLSERVHPPPDSQFVALSSDGPDCGIRADGTVECWHQWGIVGSPPPAEKFTAVSSGKYHVCGLRTDGTIACWGDNGYGQSTPPNGTNLGQFQ